MFNTLKNNNKQPTQKQPLPDQVKNSAGGYSYSASKWTQLNRFLIMGTSGGSYYASEKDLTKQNVTSVEECIKENGLRVVQELTEVSDSARCIKNDCPIYVLAMCLSLGDLATKKAAYASITKVCRTFTHLSHLLTFTLEGKYKRGWSRGLRRAVAGFYNGKSVKDIAYSIIKYAQRDGFSQKDVYRLSHPRFFWGKSIPIDRDVLYRFIGVTDSPLPDMDQQTKNRLLFETPNQSDVFSNLTQLIAAQEIATNSDLKTADVVNLIKKHSLPLEAIPTELRNKHVQEAILDSSPGYTWLIRNLGNLSANEIFTSSQRRNQVINILTDTKIIKKARIHPIDLFVALNQYSQGKGDKGSKVWNVSPQIVDALNKAFYEAFNYLEPTNKEILIAIDTSGSMSHGDVAGIKNLNVMTACAIMSLAVMKAEQNYNIIGVDTKVHDDLSLSPSQRLDDIEKVMRNFKGGGTDMALPYQYALKKKLNVDLFVTFTDSETWHGDQHPTNAFDDYRSNINNNARAIVVGACANKYTLFPDTRTDTLNVAGFDSSLPKLISLFASEGMDNSN